MTDWTGEERRTGPDPESLRSELKAVRQDMGRLAGAVATLGSDEQMQKVMTAVAEEERRHRQRILTPIIVGLLVLGLGMAGILALLSSVKDTATQAKQAAGSAAKVSSYVDHCLVHPATATPGECGNTAATGQQSATVLALFCFLELPEPQRDDTTAKDCFTKAAAQAKASSAAATTTTTRTP
jgi:hypothetical protein